MPPIVVAITGASGAAYGVRLIEVLCMAGHAVEFLISPAGCQVLKQELGLEIDPAQFSPGSLIRSPELNWSETAPLQYALPSGGTLRYNRYNDYFTGVASGSFKTAGMVVCPCSMGTLAAIAGGLSTNLIQRAADVHLKERRKLIVVPRETPLGSIQLENMKRLVDAGGIVLPAMPGFYHKPQSIEELIDFIVARVCDQLNLSINLVPRWGSSSRQG